VVRVDGERPGAPAVGAHALLAPDGPHTTGSWGDGRTLADVASRAEEALGAGRRGLVQEMDGVHVAFEVVAPVVRLVVCGSGPDALPVAALATQLGWDVAVVDHRPVEHAHPERFPGARVVECADPLRLAEAVPLTRRTAAVVMSHHFARDTDYVQALLASDVRYVGVLGPRSRTERMLADLAARGESTSAGERLYGPIGLDVGGDGREAIALAIVAEVSAAMHGRAGGHLRDRQGSLHAAPELAPGSR
jgi:xanthine dehydrogenase accessory factor